MANIAQLSVSIGADPTPLMSGVNKAKGAMNSFAKNADRAGDMTAKAFNKTKKPVRGSTMAVTNFNRIVQDAPFGIMGVANNLEPMIQSFNQLRASTGSVGGAIKQLMTSAFTGPGALITVVSVASTLLISFGDKLFGAGKKAEDVEDMMSGLNNQIDVMVKAIGEIQGVEDPFGLRKMETELRAIESREQVLETARSRIESLTKEAARLRKEGVTLTESGESIVDQDAIDRANELSQEAEKLSNKFGTTSQISTKLEKLGERRKETQQELNTSQAALNSALVAEVEARQKLFEQTKRQAEAAVIEPEPLDLGIEEQNKEILSFGRNMSNLPSMELTADASSFDRVTGKAKQMSETVRLALRGVEQEGRNLSENLANSITPMIAQSMANMAASFAEGIGQMMVSSDGLDGVFRGILSTLANLAIQVGKTAIATGIAVKGIKEALKSLNPVAAIVAGAALIAVGAAAKAALANAAEGGGGGQVAGMANGGVVPSGFPNDSFPAMLSSGEQVIPSPKPLNGNKMGTDTRDMEAAFTRALGKAKLRASGKDLVLAVNQTQSGTLR